MCLKPGNPIVKHHFWMVSVPPIYGKSLWIVYGLGFAIACHIQYSQILLYPNKPHQTMLKHTKNLLKILSNPIQPPKKRHETAIKSLRFFHPLHLEIHQISTQAPFRLIRPPATDVSAAGAAARCLGPPRWVRGGGMSMVNCKWLCGGVP